MEKYYSDLEKVEKKLSDVNARIQHNRTYISDPDAIASAITYDMDEMELAPDDIDVNEIVQEQIAYAKEYIVELEEQQKDLLQKKEQLLQQIDAESPKIEEAYKQARINVDAAMEKAKLEQASKSAADQAERQAKAEESIASSSQATAKAKLTAIQRQAYNYRRSTDNSAALAEREGVLSGQLGEIESIRNEFPALEKACASAEKAVAKTLDGIRVKMQDTGLSNVAEAAKTDATSTTQMLDAIADSIETERKNVEAAADALAESRKGVGVPYKGEVYHGSKVPLDNVTYDPAHGGGFKNLGTALYVTPNLELAEKYGENIVKKSVALKNVFMLTEGFVTNIDDLYAAIGRKAPENASWEQIKTDLNTALNTKTQIQNFTKRMQSMGYDGMYSKGYGFKDKNAEQLAIYDKAQWGGLITVNANDLKLAMQQQKTADSMPKLVDVIKDTEAAAESAVDSQNKLAQATEDTSAAANKAAQQVSEQAEITQQLATTKL